MPEFLSDQFWNNRYCDQTTGWDLGEVSPPIKAYVDQLMNKDLKILIPGCGHAYEAEYLFKQGFKNVFVLDFATMAIENFKKRVPDFPEEQMIIGDFFKQNDAYDLIIEQTLFCAIDPGLRAKYAQKCADLLCKNGKLVGLFFDREFEGGPPFGGNKEEYYSYFKDYFKRISFEKCYNSIGPRSGSELFAILEK
jgi:methyl halide transferase